MEGSRTLKRFYIKKKQYALIQDIFSLIDHVIGLLSCRLLASPLLLSFLH